MKDCKGRISVVTTEERSARHGRPIALGGANNTGCGYRGEKRMIWPEENHTEVSRQFIGEAEKYLMQGDLLQASEKAWGAAARKAKAIAEDRGWEHTRHGHLFAAIGNIVSETGRTEVRRLFREANVLHINFYEGWLTAEDVSESLEAVKELLELLDQHA